MRDPVHPIEACILTMRPHNPDLAIGAVVPAHLLGTSLTNGRTPVGTQARRV